MKKKKNPLFHSEYRVEVRYGNEKLEECIERMIETKKKNIKAAICNSAEGSL